MASPDKNHHASARAAGGDASSAERTLLATTDPECKLDYLNALIEDRIRLEGLDPNLFQHVHDLVEREIQRVRDDVIKGDQSSGFADDEVDMCKAADRDAPIVVLQHKVFAPVDKFPEYNFVGRILGPRGITVKQLEQKTGCKILVRGRGSSKDKKRNAEGAPGSDGRCRPAEELHIIIAAEDTKDRAERKLQHAKHEIDRLLHPDVQQKGGMDEVKKKQLMELAIINGTYRPPPTSTQPQVLQGPQSAYQLIGGYANGGGAMWYPQQQSLFWSGQPTTYMLPCMQPYEGAPSMTVCQQPCGILTTAHDADYYLRGVESHRSMIPIDVAQL